MFLELVVPAKRPIFSARQAQRGRSCWNFHAMRHARAGQRTEGALSGQVCGPRATGAACSTAFRRASGDARWRLQAAGHVRARARLGSLAASSAKCSVELFAQPLCCIREPGRPRANPWAGRLAARPPQGRCRRRRACQIRVKRREAERLPEKIPVEGFQMAEVKNNPVAFRDGAVVKCCRAVQFRTIRRFGRGLREGVYKVDRFLKTAPLLPDSWKIS